MVNYKHIKNNLKHENKLKKQLTLKTLLFKLYLAQITRASKNLTLFFDFFSISQTEVYINYGLQLVIKMKNY